MAVSKNPFIKWQGDKQNADYRCTDTQVTSLVRQQLSQSEYLRSSNRVNPGPRRNYRTKIASKKPQVAHVFGSQDMWGWQSWADPYKNLVISETITSLFEVANVPGVSYFPENKVGGATSSYQEYNIELEFKLPSMIQQPSSFITNINGIRVDTSSLSPGSLNYVMLYDASRNVFVFESSAYVVGSADSDGDASTINFGSY